MLEDHSTHKSWDRRADWYLQWSGVCTTATTVQSCLGKPWWVSSFLTLLLFQGCQKENCDATWCCPMQMGKKKAAWMSTVPALHSPKEGDYSHLQAGPRDGSPGQVSSLQLPRKKKQHKPLWENHLGSTEAQSCTASHTPDSQRDSSRCWNNQEQRGDAHRDSQSLSSVFSPPPSLKTSYRAEKLWHRLITVLHQQYTGKLLSDWCQWNRCKT